MMSPSSKVDSVDIAVPEASPDANAEKQTENKPAPKSRKNLWIGAFVLLAVVATIAIVVPLTMNKDDDKNKNNMSRESPAATQMSSGNIHQCFEPNEDDKCNTQESYEECLKLANNGCQKIYSTFSCPPLHRCGDETAAQLPELPPMACTMELAPCSDGSGVGRSGPNCQFEACPDGSCPIDEFVCDDGTALLRDPALGCEFEACPPPVACTMELKSCPDGSSVGRAGPNCEFEACPGESAQQLPEVAQPLSSSECPVGEGMCTMEYDPVLCGDCEYSNPCGAELAGFDVATQCAPKNQCPVGEGMCTMEYDPVICGDLSCEYPNPCGAELAGFNVATQCAPKNRCPVAGEGMCTMEYVPVLCGEMNCEYPNACDAGLAGFDAATECVLKNAPTPPVACTMELKPCPDGSSVGRTGPNCEFETCPGESAQQLPEVAQPLSSSECPVGEGMCTMEYDPVLCGDCEYSNPCGAELAGFDVATQCSPKSQCPVGEGMCTMEYLPVSCGSLGCEYPNSCNAALAGFDVDSECSPVGPAQLPEQVPEQLPMPPVMCTMELKTCPDGSSVGRTGPNCEFEECPTAVQLPAQDTRSDGDLNIGCTMDVKPCEDGSFVGREGPNCAFKICPEELNLRCSRELAYCADGTPVGRAPPACTFEACADGSCPVDTFLCPTGEELARDPNMYCEFPACPSP